MIQQYPKSKKRIYSHVTIYNILCILARLKTKHGELLMHQQKSLKYFTSVMNVECIKV